MWNGKRVSVVLMTYAERDSIRGVIERFFDTGLVDEVLVVDNNAQAGTAEEVGKTRARLVHEPQQGYGHATRRGLLEASGELIVLAEPDGTFLAEDILKLLVYSAECDVVFGTRTTRELIWAGANMARFLRWGNWAVAKLIEALYNTSHLSDVGCTYRLLRAETAKTVAEAMTVGGSHAGVEIMLLTILSGCALRRGPGQLPAPRRDLIGDRKPAQGRSGGHQDDRARAAPAAYCSPGLQPPARVRRPGALQRRAER